MTRRADVPSSVSSESNTGAILFGCVLLVALTFDKQKRGGVRSTLLLSGIEEPLENPPTTASSTKYTLSCTKPKLQKTS